MIFILSTPTLYAFLTYYHVPETDLDSDSWLGIAEHELCANNSIYKALVLDDLKYKVVIDGAVIPYSAISVREGYSGIYDVFAPPTIDIVCTTQPNLAVGQHEFVLFSYDVNSFRWVAQSKSIFYIDETGFITTT